MRIKLITLFWIPILLIMCQSSSPPNMKALDVFSDFIFVGSGQAKFLDNGQLDTSYVISHETNEQTKPQKLEVGMLYVFHYGKAVNNEILGIKELPSRLTNLGLTVLDAPKSPSELSRPYFSGPEFLIKFSDGKHIGLIYNKMDGKLMGNTSVVNEDYILVFIR